MAEVLVTGGTGVLGSKLVPALRAAGHSVRVLSRQPGEGQPGEVRMVGDLATGAGLAEAVRGAELVVHAATAARGDTSAVDVEGTRRLVVASRESGVEHLLYVSIPGVDRISLGYYRAKHAAEQIVAAAAVPYTTVRASQFHPLIGVLLRTAHRGPLLPVPADWRVEPVAVREVADHLARRLVEPPAGGVEEFGGPETREVVDLARGWLAARGERGYVLPVVFPGRLSKAVRAGANLVAPTAPRGTITWSAWLASPDAAAEVAQYTKH
jgi:uncharacterized protein YbjT (DUF2867 family)